LLVISEHARSNGRAPDWPALAATAHAEQLTLLIYMRANGLKKFKAVCNKDCPPRHPLR
jgi:hypothetical protein